MKKRVTFHCSIYLYDFEVKHKQLRIFIMNIKSTSKKFISSMLIISGMFFSVQASADQPSIEADISTFVIEQSELLVNEMTAQLEQSIAEEISEFSVAESLTWFADDVTEVATESVPSNTESQKVNTPIQLTKNSAE